MVNVQHTIRVGQQYIHRDGSPAEVVAIDGNVISIRVWGRVADFLGQAVLVYFQPA